MGRKQKSQDQRPRALLRLDRMSAVTLRPSSWFVRTEATLPTLKNPPLSAWAVDALERWDDAGRCYGHTLVFGEAPITNYRSTLCVLADAKGSAVKWSVRYTAKPGVSAAIAKKFLDDVETGGAKCWPGRDDVGEPSG